MSPRRQRLTDDECDVLRLVSHGLNLTQAADELGVARSTTSRWARSAAEKLGAENLTHAVAIALRQGLIDGDKS